MTRKISELDKTELDRAKELHKKAIFINALDSTHSISWDTEFYPTLKKAGVTLLEINVGGQTISTVVNSILEKKSILKKYLGSSYIIAERTEDIYKAKKDGKVAFFFGMQDGAAIARNEWQLETLHKIGVKNFGLAYNLRNCIADGCNELTDAGLSAFGFKVIENCNDIGLLIDLSHVGHQSSLDTIEASKKPVVFTHSNAMAIYRHRRNIQDDQIKAIAEKNGVIGVTAFGPTLRQLKSNDDKPGLEDMLNHLDYFVDSIGVNHVGIGLDTDQKRTVEQVSSFSKILSQTAAEKIVQSGPYEYSWLNWYAAEMRDYSKWPLITDGLVVRGYTDEEILKILGGNFLRVFKEVWDN